MTRYKLRQDNEGFEVPSGITYKIACVDCGLVPDFVFVNKDGKPIEMAARKNNRATAQRRRKPRGNPNPEQLDKWREDFCTAFNIRLWELTPRGNFGSVGLEREWQGYLRARTEQANEPKYKKIEGVDHDPYYEPVELQPEPVLETVLRSDFDFLLHDKQRAVKLIEEAYELLAEGKIFKAKELLEKRVNNPVFIGK